MWAMARGGESGYLVSMLVQAGGGGTGLERKACMRTLSDRVPHPNRIGTDNLVFSEIPEIAI